MVRRGFAGLGLLELSADLPAIRAVAGFPAALVAAPVLVPWTQTVLADADVSGVQVDVLPHQPERLALPQAEGEGDDPAGAVAEFRRLQQEALNLLDGVWLDLLFVQARSLGDLSDVLGDVPAPDRLAQRNADGPVNVVGGSCGAAVLLHPLVELFEVLRLQPLQLVSTEAGHEVNSYVHLVSVVAVLADVLLGDVLHPVLKPRLDGPLLSRLPHLAVLALAFQLADRLGDLGARLSLDVTAVWLAIRSDSYGDAAVPLSVGTEVDGRRAVGLPGALFPLPPRADSFGVGMSTGRHRVGWRPVVMG